MPKAALSRFSGLVGDNTSIIIFVTYGNRHYDDALLELKDLVSSKGFRVIGAAAFVTEHSIVPSIGKDRPDSEDISLVNFFSDKLKQKIYDTHDFQKDILIPGNHPYRNYQSIFAKPHGNNKCIKCMLCYQKCPVHAIEKQNPRKTTREKCVTCMRCVNLCPVKARKLSKLDNIVARQFLLLIKKCSLRKISEIFL